MTQVIYYFGTWEWGAEEFINYRHKQLTTGRVNQVATTRSVSQRYQAGEIDISGSRGPSMKMLPKKLPKKSASTK